jgi:uncharacterized protein YcbK (DUF882 family)
MSLSSAHKSFANHNKTYAGDFSYPMVREAHSPGKGVDMSISRRALLRMSGGALASVVGLSVTARALAAPALVGLKELNARTLSFEGYNTGEQLKEVTYWAEGKYVPDALAEINKAMRDWRTGEVYPIEPKVLDVLHQIGRTLETKCQFELISGYRSPKTNAMLHEFDPGVATNSLHMKGFATDISLPGRPLRKVYETALAMQMGGVGYYPDSNFIHVDVGRVRRWVG